MMLTGMPTPKDILSTFAPFGPPVLSSHGLPDQALPAVTQPLTKVLVDVTPYPESATQWLTSLLDLFIGIVNRNEDLSRVVVTETEYQQLSGVLDDLIYSVGEDESHPLSATMTLVGVLIKVYEDQHFPKLADIFPELSKETPDKTISEDRQVSTNVPGQIEADFVSVFFSIGCLLWRGGQIERAISAYNSAIRLNPNHAGIYASRGEAKSSLNDLMGAKTDLQKALTLTEKQGEDGFSTAIKDRLEEFDVVEAVIVYFSEPRFAKFSIIRECRIQIGPLHSRADIVLRDAQENFIAITECKLPGGPSYAKPLQSFLCATDTPFGIFASSPNRDSWVFYENLRHNRFQRIERLDFEKRVLA